MQSLTQFGTYGFLCNLMAAQSARLGARAMASKIITIKAAGKKFAPLSNESKKRAAGTSVAT